MLIGCEKAPEIKEPSLEDLGYSESDIELIKTLPAEYMIAMFLDGYNEKYVDLIHNAHFEQERFYEYIEVIDEFGADMAVKLVNTNINMDKLRQLYKNEYFINKNEDLYLEHLIEYESVRDCIEAVNTKTYLDYYSDIEDTDISKNYLMLINKYYALSSDYVPDDLVEIDPHYGRGYTRAEVYEQYMKLQDDANELGYDFVVCSPYRSYNTQYTLYNRYIEQENGNQSIVDTYSARPGHSEHQSGLCLDLSDAVYGMDNFGQSEASTWVNENCYKYGFIIRYTEEKQKITGYEAEPWQIRYVGSSEIAKDIMDRGITFDEYYACFVEE